MSDSTNPICRICLTTEYRSYYSISLYSDLMQDLGGISVQESDGFPTWLCCECIMMLKKCCRFKEKMLRAHSVLYEYLTRCAPFPIDGTDVELLKFSSPQLAVTPTLICDSSKSRTGFHKVLQHKNVKPIKLESHLLNVQPTFLETASLKNEPDFSDYEDNIPLEEYKNTIDKFSESDLSVLLKDGVNVEVKSEDVADIISLGKRKRKGNDKEKGRKRRKRSKSPINTDQKPPKTIQRQPKSIKDPDVDPTKIKIITLNPEEQILDMKLESEKDGICKLKFKCSLCFKGFNYQEKLDNHMMKHSPSRGKFMCELCHMYLPTPNSYNVHMFIHTRRYECLKCGRRMIDRQSIVDHYRSQHEGLVTHYTCHLCGKISSNNKTHRGHMRNHHGGQRPKCDLCGKSFVNKDSLTEHILIHQGIKSYECIKCGKTFRTKTQLKHHQLKHTDVKLFYCVECDTRFKTAHSLKQHLTKSAKHRDVQSLPFACTTCDKRFQTSLELSHHDSVQHRGERPYQCGLCPARLATTQARKKHERRHTDNKPASLTHCCHTCGRTFSRASILLAHTHTHTGVRPHTCASCSRSFTQRAALVTHVKLVHLHVKRTDKVKTEIINSIDKYLSQNQNKTNYTSSKQALQSDQSKITANNLKILDNQTKISRQYKIENNQRNSIQGNTNMGEVSTNMTRNQNDAKLMIQNQNDAKLLMQNQNDAKLLMQNQNDAKLLMQTKIVQNDGKLTVLQTLNVKSIEKEVASKFMIVDSKLIPADRKLMQGDNKLMQLDNKLMQAENKLMQVDVVDKFGQKCSQPKEETIFDEEWRQQGINNVYYYIPQ